MPDHQIRTKPSSARTSVVRGGDSRPANSIYRPPELDPAWFGRSAAVAHGPAELRPTHDYRAERLQLLYQALGHLCEIIDHDEDEAAGLLFDQLRYACRDLDRIVPRSLPFLPNGKHLRLRLRIAAVTREWLLVSRAPRRPQEFQQFLRAYQEETPLAPNEIRLIPTALRLAVAEKCLILPSPGKSSHAELIPRLLQDLINTCRIITDTDWPRFLEAAEVSA